MGNTDGRHEPSHDDAAHGEQARIDELTALIHQQQARLDALEQQVRVATSDVRVTTTGTTATTAPIATRESAASSTTSTSVTDTPTSSRRNLLKLAGASAAGAAVATTAGISSPVAANTLNGQAVELGESNRAQSRTKIVANGPALPNDYVFGAGDYDTATDVSAGIGGFANGTKVSNGVHGRATAHSASNAKTGHGVVAERAGTARSNLFMPASGAVPSTDTTSHVAGEMRVDSTGALWFCVEAGTPGTWQLLASSDFDDIRIIELIRLSLFSLPLTLPVAPGRVYDSRLPMGTTPSGALRVGESRIIPCRDYRDVETGAVTTPNALLVGSIAMTYTVSIIAPQGAGFLAVNPRSITDVRTATINFDATSPTVLNNTSYVGFGSEGDREIRVIAGGVAGGAVDFTIDVVAATLSFGAAAGPLQSGGLSDETLSAMSRLLAD